MTSQKTMDARAWSLIVLLAFIWGASFLGYALALRELPVLTVVALRVAIAALVVGLAMALAGRPFPRGLPDWIALAVMGLTNVALPFTLIAFGQTRIESGLASIFNATTALFGVVIAAFFFTDESLTARKIAGVVLGIAGVAVIAGPDALGGFDLRSEGQLAALLASFFYALSGSLARRFLTGLSPEGASFGMLASAAVLLVPLALMIEGRPAATASPATIGAILYLSVIASALAYLVYYRLLARAGAGNLMLVTLILVPVAVLLGAVVLGERLGPNEFAGFAVIALGLVVIDGRLFSRGGGPG
jgi:drug/metabolite transporter (DMT)-like permease